MLVQHRHDSPAVSLESVIEFLDEYDDWRHGKGKYAWSDKPEENMDFVYSSLQTTEYLRAARAYLNEIAGKNELKTVGVNA